MRTTNIIAVLACLAGTAQAAPPSPADTPVQPAASRPSATGGWTREGWSDAAPAVASRPAPMMSGRGEPSRGAGRGLAVSDGDHAIPSAAPRAPRRDAATAPPPVRDDSYRDARRGARSARDDGWRRQTWDGGRGRDFSYRRGGALPAMFGAPVYLVSDWGGYGLAPPPPGGRWVRYFDDAVLVDPAGVVIDAVPDIGWAQPPYPYDRGPPPPGPGYVAGPGTTVTRGAGGAIVVTTTTAPAVSTTTTTVTESYVPARRIPPRRR